jgi:SAM-dependent methyltransferase
MEHGTRIQDLREVVPWGRNFQEYVRFFALTPDDLSLRILDCGGGPASFTAEAAERGHTVVACDPIYRFTSAEIETRVNEVEPIMREGLIAEHERFIWTYAGSPEELSERRLAAMRHFLADFTPGLKSGRYLAEGLPRLPLANQVFDLALSSHFLFLYSDQLSLDFHLSAITEMLRVAREARFYPLMALDGTRSHHLNLVMSTMQAEGCSVELVPIPFEFQKGANQMLRITRMGVRTDDVVNIWA